LCDVLSPARVTNNPKRDPAQSTPEVLHKPPGAFFVSGAEAFEEKFV